MLKQVIEFLRRAFGGAPMFLPSSSNLELPKGDVGEKTKALQQKLKRLGYSVSGGTDGLLGDYTMGSVQEFLEDQDLTDDMVERDVGVSDRTLKALDQAIKEARLPEDLPLKVGDDGDRVVELQQKLIALGFDLPRFGADGELGEETIQAVLAFQFANGIKDENAEIDRGVGDDTLEAILEASLPDPVEKPLAFPRLERFPGLPLPSNLVIVKDDHELKKGSGHRKLKDIKGVVLHQTATVLGENPKRWHGVACHIGITREGKIIWINDFDKIVWHGDGFNRGTIGIEIDGHFAGLESFNEETGKWVPDLSTYWRPKGSNRQPLSITDVQVEAVKQVVRWIHRVIKEGGGKLEFLLAHRQSSGSRRSDPGQKPWRLIALPLMEELNLTDGGPDYFILDRHGKPGYPVSEEWDPRHKGVSYRKLPRQIKGRKKRGP
jgi:peptidoglycan hydrolase-like protein with peptidoglycan-binding domain